MLSICLTSFTTIAFILVCLFLLNTNYLIIKILFVLNYFIFIISYLYNICQACIREHDHHCPWTGKCIGKYNLISFYIFVNSLMAYLIMIFVTFYGYMFYRNLRKKPIK